MMVAKLVARTHYVPTCCCCGAEGLPSASAAHAEEVAVRLGWTEAVGLWVCPACSEGGVLPEVRVRIAE